MRPHIIIRRLGRASGLFFALSLVLAGTAGGGPQSYYLVPGELVTHATVVQQPGVVNVTDCLWDVDDNWSASAVGRRIEAGVVASASVCLIADGHQPFWGVRVRAESDKLLVSLRFEPQGVTFRASPVRLTAKVWEYRGCMFGPSYSDWSGLPEIPDSNGGHGLVTTVTATVENPTGRNVANPEAQFVEKPGLRSEYCNGVSVNYSFAGTNWTAAGLTPDG